VGGAANREVLTILAGALGVAASTLELEMVAGSHGREKRVRVHGLGPGVVRTRLTPLLQFDRAEARD
jgi:uncharacterized protein YggU (UPF0235/DUF167 family)